MESTEPQSQLSSQIPSFLKDNAKWIQTKDDGVLLFKNVSFNIKETDKEDRDDNKYPHNEENIIIDFEDEKEKYETDFKYFNVQKNKFCTVTSKEQEEDGTLKHIMVKLEDSDEEIKISSNQLHQLKDHLPVKIRILGKAGNKVTLAAELALSDTLTIGLEKAFSSLGLKAMRYKVFHGKDILPKSATIESCYKSDSGLDFF